MNGNVKVYEAKFNSFMRFRSWLQSNRIVHNRTQKVIVDLQYRSDYGVIIENSLFLALILQHTSLPFGRSVFQPFQEILDP